VRSLILLFMLLLLPGSVSATELTEYNGTFVLADEEATAAALEAAVEQGAEQFPALVRPLVRRKLKGAVNAVRFFTFEPGKDSIRIRSDLNEAGWLTDLEGTLVEVADANGNPVRLKRWMQDGVLAAQGCTEKGCSDFLFKLSDDGKSMVFGVVTHADALKEPLRYELTYTRR